MGSQDRVAQSFTTPSTRPGQQYRLGTIRIGIGTETVTPITVELYSDDGLGDGTIENHSSPDTLLANMFVPDGLATGSRRPIENFVAVAPFNTLLSPETRYWIVVINESETSGVFDNQASISATVPQSGGFRVAQWLDNRRPQTRRNRQSAFLAEYRLSPPYGNLGHTNIASNG